MSRFWVERSKTGILNIQIVSPTSTVAPRMDFAAIKNWLRLKQLEREIRRSQKFQKECENLRCPTLAACEKDYREELSDEIQALKKKNHP